MSDFPMAPAWQVSQWLNTTATPSLESLRGRVVVMHAFQMLCPGCVLHAVPQAERIHQQFSGENIAVIGLHTVFEHHAAMQPIALKAFLHEFRITHPIGVDAPVSGHPIPATMAAYHMQGTPTFILIDRQGRLRQQVFGRIDDMVVGAEIMRLLCERLPE